MQQKCKPKQEWAITVTVCWVYFQSLKTFATACIIVSAEYLCCLYTDSLCYAGERAASNRFIMIARKVKAVGQFQMWHFTALTFTPLAILPIYGKHICIPLPYPSWHLHHIKARVRLDQVFLHYAHNEWSSIMSPGLSIIGLWTFKILQEVVQVEMLPYYFPGWVTQ